MTFGTALRVLQAKARGVQVDPDQLAKAVRAIDVWFAEQDAKVEATS